VVGSRKRGTATRPTAPLLSTAVGAGAGAARAGPRARARAGAGAGARSAVLPRNTSQGIFFEIFEDEIPPIAVGEMVVGGVMGGDGIADREDAMYVPLKVTHVETAELVATVVDSTDSLRFTAGALLYHWPPRHALPYEEGNIVLAQCPVGHDKDFSDYLYPATVFSVAGGMVTLLFEEGEDDVSECHVVPRSRILFFRADKRPSSSTVLRSQQRTCDAYARLYSLHCFHFASTGGRRSTRAFTA